MSLAVTVGDINPELMAASEAGPAPKRIVVAFGFWIFLLSDIVMFSALFGFFRLRAIFTPGSV